MKELAKQMQAHGIRDPEDLTEFDQEWVNPATKTDIETIMSENNTEVFGLSVWTWKKTRGTDLKGACTFSVDYVFKNTDEAAVDKIIAEYEKKAEGKEWDKEMQKLAWKVVTTLSRLALDTCLWV